MKHMLGKKLKILLAVGAASAVMLAAGCGGGDSKSSSASGIPNSLLDSMIARQET